MKNQSSCILWLKSILFSLVFYIGTLVLFILYAPTLLMPRKIAMAFPLAWTRTMTFMLRLICNIKINVEGLENLPKENGYIIASKHQSAMETVLFHKIVPNTFYVLKKELLYLPLAGFYFLKTGCVPIDRKGGSKTMRKMLSGVKQRLNEKMNLTIFPEGTRTAPGASAPYAPGIAFLYDQCKVPVIPVALNSGYCWPKNKTIKYPGTVTVRFLPPIAPGLEKRAFLQTLESRIETAQKSLPNPFEK